MTNIVVRRKHQKMRAWVIVANWHDMAPPLPGLVQGAPLAMLRGRAKREAVEGAMIAVRQTFGGRSPSQMLEASRNVFPLTVDWDKLRWNGYLRGLYDVHAHLSEVLYRERPVDPATGEGVIVSYTFRKQVSGNEWLDLADTIQQAGGPGASDPSGEAERQLRKRTVTFRVPETVASR